MGAPPRTYATARELQPELQPQVPPAVRGTTPADTRERVYEPTCPRRRRFADCRGCSMRRSYRRLPPTLQCSSRSGTWTGMDSSLPGGGGSAATSTTTTESATVTSTRSGRFDLDLFVPNFGTTINWRSCTHGQASNRSPKTRRRRDCCFSKCCTVAAWRCGQNVWRE